MTRRDSTSPHVRRRRVLYIHGFDPRGPAVYHGMYAREAEKQGALTGAAYAVTPRRNDGPHAAQWEIATRMPDGTAVETAYTLLRWDDIVRAHWPKGRLALLRDLTGYFSGYVRSGFLKPLKALSRPAWLAIHFPPVVVGLYALLAVLLGAAKAAALAAFGFPAWAVVLGFLVWPVLAWVAWPAVESLLNVCWLTRVFVFLKTWSDGRVPDLAARHAIFAARIREALADESADEVLVIGHSIGAHHAIAALGAVLEGDPRAPDARPRLSLLTLGQSVPLLSALGAPEFRGAVRNVARAHGLVWVDVTSPSDPASSGAVDPIILFREDAIDDAHARPVQVSPRFHLVLSADDFRRIRMQPFAFHFQYLHATQTAGGYDFFALTAGPAPLSADSARGAGS